MIRSLEFDLPSPLQPTHLPGKGEIPQFIAGGPSVNRWQPNESTRWGKENIGPLPNLLESLAQRIGEVGLSTNTWLIFSDATCDWNNLEWRKTTLPQLDLGSNPPRLFFLLPEFQAFVAKHVKEITGYADNVIKASLQGFGYGDHRVTLDRVMGAITSASESAIGFVSMDDDMVIPPYKVQWRKDRLPHGLTEQPNSQVLSREPPDDSLEKMPGNSIALLFTSLGKTVSDMRQQYPGIQTVESVRDTRAQAFLRSLNGEPTQFVVSYPDMDMLNAEKGVIVATTATKGYRPDVHSYVVAQMALAWEYPRLEVPLESYRSGPPKIFAAQSSSDIFPDAAAFGRWFDTQTIYWPWMFTANTEASQRNTLKIITGQPRADIDMLPQLLKIISQASEKPYLYLNVDTDTMHSRARLGANRQEIHEGTISAMVGFIAEAEVLRRLYFDYETGLWKVDRNGLAKLWRAEEDHTRTVFNKIARLGMMATAKRIELEGQRVHITDPEDLHSVNEKIQKYLYVASSISEKLGGVSFKPWLQHLDQDNLKNIEYPTLSADYSRLMPTNFMTFWRCVSDEVRDHVLFYADVVDAAPTIIIEVTKLINNDQYPVAEYKPNKPPQTTSYPSGVIYNRTET